MRNPFNFADWAMPVKSKPWGVITVLAEWVKRASRYKLMVRTSHRAWEHAVGVR